MGRLQQLYRAFDRNLPTILTISGAIGSATALVTGVLESPLAQKRIRDELNEIRKEQGLDQNARPKLGRKEFWRLVKVAAPILGPSVALEVISIICMFGSLKEGNRRQAALVGLSMAYDSDLKALRKKVEELVGPEKTDEIYHSVAKDEHVRLIETHPMVEHEIIVTGDGNMRFHDLYTDKWFYSSLDYIRNAVVEYNTGIVGDLGTEDSLETFYQMLHIPTLHMGFCRSVGFNIDNQLVLRYDAVHDLDNQYTTLITYVNEPRELNNYGWKRNRRY